MASIMSSVSTLVESGLQGPAALTPAHAHAPDRRHPRFLARGGAVGLVVALRLFNPMFLPGPWLVFGSVASMARRVSCGAHGGDAAAVAFGFGTGAGLASRSALRPAIPGAGACVVEPIVELLRPIPPLAMLPLFIVWIGIGEASKIGFITYATFFPMFLSTVHAVRQVDPLLVRAAASLGARRAQLFSRVILPAALPEIFTGIRLGVALSFFVIVISEFIGAERGLGYLINDGRNFFLVPQMLGAAVVLGGLGVASSALVALLERRLLRWQYLR